MGTIILEVKSHYGNERIYPVNFKGDLQVLTGQKTLSRYQLKALKAMGFKFELKTQSLAEVLV